MWQCLTVDIEFMVCRCATDGMRPPVDLEDAALLRRMFLLFHSTSPSPQDANSERRITPASPAVRARLVGLFSRSMPAASMFPDNLRVSPKLVSSQLLPSCC